MMQSKDLGCEMNASPDRKKVKTFLFTFNYMHQPWRLDAHGEGELAERTSSIRPGALRSSGAPAANERPNQISARPQPSLRKTRHLV